MELLSPFLLIFQNLLTCITIQIALMGQITNLILLTLNIIWWYALLPSSSFWYLDILLLLLLDVNLLLQKLSNLRIFHKFFELLD